MALRVGVLGEEGREGGRAGCGGEEGEDTVSLPYKHNFLLSFFSKVTVFVASFCLL